MTIYIDINGNNTLDQDEIDAGYVATTAADGTWSISGIGPDALGGQVREVVPDGHEQLGPVEYEIGDVRPDGGKLDDLDFFNYPLLDITGCKVEDANGNGVYDQGIDILLAGWVIELWSDEDGSGTVNDGDVMVDTTTTDDEGKYSFTGLIAGNYIVKEVVPDSEDPADWKAITPEEVVLGQLAPGEDATADFFNFRLFKIEGTKYLENEETLNGQLDEGELGQEGVRIYIDLNGNDQYDEDTEAAYSAITDINGYWCIDGIDEAALGKAVREVVPPDFIQTGPEGDEHQLGDVSEDRSGLDFFNFDPDDGQEPEDPGSGNTPGFWKNHLEIFDHEVGPECNSDLLYENVFGVTLMGSPVKGKKKLLYPDDPTLAEALGANGGGEGALLRSSTAALANAASDNVNYCYSDEETFMVGVEAVTGIDPDIDGVAFAEAMMAIQDTLLLIDRDDDGCITKDEVILAVQDLYGDIGADDEFDLGDINDVAFAFDAMNNMPSVEKSVFLADMFV